MAIVSSMFAAPSYFSGSYCVTLIDVQAAAWLPRLWVVGLSRRHFSRMSFLTDVTPFTLRAISTAFVISALELTKPLS